MNYALNYPQIYPIVRLNEAARKEKDTEQSSLVFEKAESRVCCERGLTQFLRWSKVGV